MEKRTTFFDKKELSKRDQDFIDADNKEQALNDLAEQAQSEAMSKTNPNTMWTEMTYKHGFIAGFKQSEQRCPSDSAIKLLTDYNDWRRGAEIDQPNPIEIGKAIEEVLALFPKVGENS